MNSRQLYQPALEVPLHSTGDASPVSVRRGTSTTG